MEGQHTVKGAHCSPYLSPGLVIYNALSCLSSKYIVAATAIISSLIKQAWALHVSLSMQMYMTSLHSLTPQRRLRY